MSVLYYNPFFPLSDGLLEHLLRQGKRYWVVQRFLWPGLKEGKAFLASEYADKAEAEDHAMQLEAGEGKLLDLEVEESLQKIRDLTKSTEFKIFYHSTIDEKNEKKLHKAYVKKVHGYIQSIRMKNDGGFDVYIRVVNGRVRGVITSGNKTHEAPFYQMIK